MEECREKLDSDVGGGRPTAKNRLGIPTREMKRTIFSGIGESPPPKQISSVAETKPITAYRFPVASHLEVLEPLTMTEVVT